MEVLSWCMRSNTAQHVFSIKEKCLILPRLSASHIASFTIKPEVPHESPLCPLHWTHLKFLKEPELWQVCENIYIYFQEEIWTCQIHLWYENILTWLFSFFDPGLIFLSFWLTFSPEALKSLCCSSAGLSMLPVSTHCCLSTNKAIEW